MPSLANPCTNVFQVHNLKLFEDHHIHNIFTVIQIITKTLSLLNLPISAVGEEGAQ